MPRVRLLIGGLVALAMVAWAPGVAAAASDPTPHIIPNTGLGLGFMPTKSVRAAAARRSAVAASAPTPSLKDLGGPIVSDPQVENVLWGSTGTYLPQVTGTGAGNIDQSTNDQLTSEWERGLDEYDTTTQRLQPGRVIGRTPITPTTNTTSTVYDTDIQTELLNQINDGNLPAPTFDSTGAAETIYTLYFPANVTICDASQTAPGGGVACSDNTFCAYHNSFVVTDNGVERMILYIVSPDASSSAYLAACGDSGESSAEAMQVIESHELAESITDPGVNTIMNNTQQTAWYDQNYGEAADICEAGAGAPGWAWNPDSVIYQDSLGYRYAVQQVWSNHYVGCAPTYPSAPRTPQVKALPGGRVRLTWTTPSDDGRAPIQGYDIFVHTATGNKPIATVIGHSWTSPAYPYGRSKTFIVDAWNNAGGGVDGDDSHALTVVPASTPKVVPWLRVTRHGSAPTVAWTAATGNGATITRYVLTGPGGTHTLRAGARSFHWTHVKPGRYTVTLRAGNRIGLGVVRRVTLVVP